MSDTTVMIVEQLADNRAVYKMAVEAFHCLLFTEKVPARDLIFDYHKAVYAKYDDKVVGILVFNIGNDGNIIILLAYVHVNWRNKGIYKSMLKCLADWGKVYKVKKIKAEISTENDESVRIFERCGFRKIYVGEVYQIDE